jgi:hypothetical protein
VSENAPGRRLYWKDTPDSQLDPKPPMTPNAPQSRSDGSDARQDAAGIPLAQAAATTTGDWGSAPLSLAGPIYRHHQNRFGQVIWILD